MTGCKDVTVDSVQAVDRVVPLAVGSKSTTRESSAGDTLASPFASGVVRLVIHATIGHGPGVNIITGRRRHTVRSRFPSS